MKKRIISTEPDLKILIKDTNNKWSITGKSGSKIGTIHDVIIDNYPHLEAITNLHHSSVSDGKPNMYDSTALYFCGLTEFKDHEGTPLPSRRLLCEKLRMTESMAQKMIEEMNKFKNSKKSKTPSQNDLTGKIRVFLKDNMFKQWEDEAKKAREVFKEIESVNL